jgi:tetratricopeptide (TPR) repeat protein
LVALPCVPRAANGRGGVEFHLNQPRHRSDTPMCRAPIEAQAGAFGQPMGQGGFAMTAPGSISSAAIAVCACVAAALVAPASAQSQPPSTQAVGRPMGPGAFFFADGPNPFAGPAEAVFECKFFSNDTERKIKGCTDLITDAKGEPRSGVAYVRVGERRGASNLAAAYYHRALGHRERGAVKDAEADLDEAIRLDPQMPKAFDARGRLHHENGRPDQAISDLNEAVRLDPNSAYIRHHRGAAHSAKGQYDRAIADFSEAVRLDPKLVNAYFNRAEIYRRVKGDLKRALQDLNETIQRAPNHALAYDARGQLYGNSDQVDQAIADFSQAIRLAPKYALAHSNRAVAYYQKGELDRVIADSSEAIQLDAKLVKAFIIRALALEKSGRPGKALADYKKVLELEPSNGIAAQALKRLSSVEGPSAEASSVVKIEQPRLGNLRLDWCREWAQQCGKAAADEFCRRQGFAEAASFAKAANVGEPTRVIGSGQVCNQPSCAGFAAISCRKS